MHHSTLPNQSLDGFNSQTVLHIYLPKSIKSLKGEFLLVGSFSIERNIPKKSAKYKQCYNVAIFGAIQVNTLISNPLLFPDASSQTMRRGSFPTIIGYIGTNGKIETEQRAHFSSISPIPSSLEKSSLWISLTPSCSISQIYVNNTKLFSHQDVIILEFDPYTLSRCLIMQKSEAFVGVPITVIESFDLVTLLPSEGIKLLPSIGAKRRAQTEFDSSSEEDDEEEDDESLITKSFKDNLIEKMSREASKKSAGVKQLVHRCNLLSKMMTRSPNWVVILNILSLIVVDILLGVSLTYIFQSHPINFGDFESNVDKVLKLLMRLLHWLNGSPAGLKLNAPFNSLLHRFFSYHLHLWQSYIGFLEPVLTFLGFFILNIGYFGMTFQIALAKDLLTLASFHVYCLYIYATRLFYIELNTLKTLSRLFLGKKWNPLRKRIDTVTLSLSEMFIGSLGFTISFFLLPTILVYYVVFLFLRLPLLLFESALSSFIDIFNSIQLGTAFLIYSNSSWIADEIYMAPLQPVEFMSKRLSSRQPMRFEILTQTSTRRPFYKLPNLKKGLSETISSILESKIIS